MKTEKIDRWCTTLLGRVCHTGLVRLWCTAILMMLMIMYVRVIKTGNSWYDNILIITCIYTRVRLLCSCVSLIESFKTGVVGALVVVVGAPYATNGQKIHNRMVRYNEAWRVWWKQQILILVGFYWKVEAIINDQKLSQIF